MTMNSKVSTQWNKFDEFLLKKLLIFQKSDEIADCTFRSLGQIAEFFNLSSTELLDEFRLSVT